jgi:transketolase
MAVKLKTEELENLENMAYQIRRLSLEMICRGQWGHLGGSFSLAEILSVLYFHTLNITPDNPSWDHRDRLVLSKAHGSPALYAVLYAGSSL